MQSSPSSRVAALVLALEAVVVLFLAGIQIVEIVQGHLAVLSSAIALVVLTLVMGIGIFAFAWGVFSGQTWGRSGGTVTQLMILAIALGAVTGAYSHPAVAAAIAIPAIVGLIAIFQASKRTARAEKAEKDALDAAENAGGADNPSTPPAQ